MLKKLRSKKIAKKVWIILAILILPAFVLWGSGSLIRDKREKEFTEKIFDKRISPLEYKDALDAVKTAAIMQYGENFSEIRKYLDLESLAWERLILLYEARKRKLTATDREVIELIQGHPFFQRRGEFDNAIYNQMLQYVFHTPPRIFEEEMRQNIMLSKLYEQLTKEVQINDQEIVEEYRRLNEEISVDYIIGSASQFSKSLQPSEEQIKDYFTKNPLLFKQPVSFNIEYVISESEDKMKKLASGLSKKSDFVKKAKGLGLEVKESGLFTQIDPIPGIGWSAEITKLISELKVGQYSALIPWGENYGLIKLKERKEVFVPDFAQVKDKAKEMLIKAESEMLAKQKIEECLKKLKQLHQKNPKPAVFNKISQECGLKSGSTDLFKSSGYIDGIGATDKLWTTASKLKNGEISEVISMPSGFYIVRLKGRTRFDQKKFENEKEGFSQGLLLQKKQVYFSKFLEGLKRKTSFQQENRLRR